MKSPGALGGLRTEAPRLPAAGHRRRPVPGRTTTAPLPVRTGVTCPRALSRFTQAAAELIGDHQITVLADRLVQRRGAGHRLSELLAADAVPYATLMSGKCIADESSPAFLGVYAGAAGEEPVRRAIEEAPVLVAAGVQFSDVNSGFFSHNIDPARTIDVGATRSTVGGQVFAPLDMEAALAELTRIVRSRDNAPVLAARMEQPRDHRSPDTVLTQELLWDNVSEALNPGNVVVADQGTSYYGVVGRRLPSGVTFIGQPLWASIGYALPAALGAALADRDRRTVLLIGDGAAQLTIQELGVMFREGVAPVIVVVNNNGYTIERAIHGETACYNDIVAWRWLDIPGALGVGDHLGFTARTCGELDHALTQAAAHPDRMAVIEVLVPSRDVPHLLGDLARSAAAANAPSEPSQARTICSSTVAYLRPPARRPQLVST